jgi:hypothetical protein
MTVVLPTRRAFHQHLERRHASGDVAVVPVIPPLEQIEPVR